VIFETRDKYRGLGFVKQALAKNANGVSVSICSVVVGQK
jgi:hypothetical protein